MFDIIILGFIQGVAEFLPISSKGHLAIAENLFGVKDPLFVTIMLHAGTLVAIVAFYYKQLLDLLKPENFRLVLMIVVGTIPVGVIGVGFKLAHFDDILSNLFVAGFGFIVTGFILLYGLRKHEDMKGISEMGWKDVMSIAFMQCAAIFPGVSRSGTTISTALKLNVKREDAATFSFFLAIPAIGGAGLVESLSKLRHMDQTFTHDVIIQMIVGFIISAIVGYAALYLLVNTLNKGKFSYYAYYCFILGAAVLVWQTISFFK